MSSVPDRVQSNKHTIVYPQFRSINYDQDRLIIRINHPNPERRNFYLLAPSKNVFDAVLEKMDEYMEANEPDDNTAEYDPEQDKVETPDDFEEETDESLIEYHDSSTLGLLFFLLLFPLRFLMHWTIPDVRRLDARGNPHTTLASAYLAVFMCLVWLIVGSYAMVSSLEHLSDWLNIPTAVVGVTVSAAGTSLPNYVASKIAAEKGLGVCMVVDIRVRL